MRGAARLGSGASANEVQSVVHAGMKGAQVERLPLTWFSNNSRHVDVFTVVLGA